MTKKAQRSSVSTLQKTYEVLDVISQQLSPEEAADFFAGLPLGTGVERLAYKVVAARNATKLFKRGFHLEASRIFLDLGSKKRALKAVSRGRALNRANPEVLDILRELEIAAKELPG